MKHLSVEVKTIQFNGQEYVKLADIIRILQSFQPGEPVKQDVINELVYFFSHFQDSPPKEITSTIFDIVDTSSSSIMPGL